MLFSPILKLFHSIIAWFDCWSIVIVWVSELIEISPVIVELPLGNSAHERHEKKLKNIIIKTLIL